jgi:hypothetical protein
VLAGCGVLGVFLWWATTRFDWLGMPAVARMGTLLGVVGGGAVLYLLVVRVLGLDVRQFLRPEASQK